MSPIALELGSGYLSILPDGSKFGPALSKEIGDDLDRGGTDAGRRAGAGFGATFGAGIKSALGAAAVAFAGLQVGNFLLGAIDSASDLNEIVSKTGQIFGQDAIPGLEAFAASAAKALGLSKIQALDAAATFGVFGKSAGLTGDSLSGFSTGLVGLTADMASFSNTTPEEAITAVGAALRGESEPIARYGVLLNEANLRQRALALGLISTTKEALTPQQRVLAAHAEILAQTADQQGNFALTSDDLAQKQKTLTAEFANGKAALGQALLPAATAVVTFMVDKAIPAFQAFSDKIRAAFGEGGISGVFDMLRAEVERFGPIIQPILADLGKAFGDWLVTSALPWAVQRSAEFLGWFLGWVTDAGMELLSRVPGWAAALTDWFVTTAIPWGLAKAEEFIAAILEWVTGTALPYLVDKAPEWAAALVDWITDDAIPAAVSKLGDLFGAFAGWVSATLPKVKSQGVAIGRDLIGGLASGLESFFSQSVVPFFQSLPGRVASLAAGSGSWLFAAGQNLVNGLAVGAESMMGSVFSVLGGLAGRARAAVGDLGSALYQAGRDVISGLVRGIRDAIPSVTGVLAGVTNLIPSWKGPAEKDLRLLRPSGRMVLEGFMAGIADQLPALRVQLGGVTAVVASTAPAAVPAPFVAPAPAPAPGAGGLTASDQVHTHVYLDRKQIAEAIGTYERSRR